jgi:hypothetical protein
MIHLHLGQFHSSSAVMRSRVLDWQSGTVGSDLPYNIDERQVSRNAEFPRQSGLPKGDVYTLRDLGLLIYQRGVSASLSLRLSKSTNRTTITKQTKSGEITMPGEETNAYGELAPQLHSNPGFPHRELHFPSSSTSYLPAPGPAPALAMTSSIYPKRRTTDSARSRDTNNRSTTELEPESAA